MQPTKSLLDYMNEMNRLFPRTGDNDFPSTPNTSQSFNQSLRSSSTDTSPDSFDMARDQFLLGPLQSPVRPNQSPARPETRLQDYQSLDFLYPYETDVRMRPQDYKRSEFSHPKETDIPQHYQRSEFFHPMETDFLLRPQDSQRHLYNTDVLSRNLDSERLEYPYSQDTEMQFTSQLYETPVVRQRYIVGRKILTPEHHSETNIWAEEQHTPPNSKITPSYYELFPSDKKGMEFKIPVYYTPPKMTDTSPKFNTSPRMLGPMLQEMSPNRKTPPMSNISPYSQRFSAPAFKEPIVTPSTSYHQSGQNKMCTFCRKNGETPLVYMTHAVKEKIGKKNVVTCPILRSHVCSTCGATGDDSHTISYCPVLRRTNNGQPLQSTTITLKSTRVKSNGRRRF